jgi:hypothetical protein
MRYASVKIPALCTLALAVMAISAGAAQAEKGAFWLVNGAKISESLLPTLGGELENNTGKLLATLAGTAFHITCLTATTVGAHLVEPNGGVLGLGRFTGCKFFTLKNGGAGEELLVCEPHEGAEKGVILTKELKGLIVLDKSTSGADVLLEPKTGTLFATINLSELCPFGEAITVSGKLSVQDCEGKFLTDLKKHLIIELAALTELYINGSKVNRATLDGSANIFLTGSHEGLTFAGHPA